MIAFVERPDLNDEPAYSPVAAAAAADTPAVFIPSSISSSSSSLPWYAPREILHLLDEFKHQQTTEGSGLSFLQLSTLLAAIIDQNLVNNARTTGKYILNRLNQIESAINEAPFQRDEQLPTTFKVRNY
jgi:hypothetical protein